MLRDVARDLSRWRALECPLPKRSLEARAGPISRATSAFCNDNVGIMFNLCDADH